MHTYRRLASTATSTSRSASSSMAHHHHHHHHHNHYHHGLLSRSSSTSTVSITTAGGPSSSSVLAAASPTTTVTVTNPSGVYSPTTATITSGHGAEPPILTTTNALGKPLMTVGIPRTTTATSQSPTSATTTSHPLSAITSSPTESYTRAELQTIAESLLAHVSFGPYHLACSPVPPSHLRQHMGATNATTNANHNNNSATTTAYYINPSSTSSSAAQIYHPPALSTSSSAATIYQKENQYPAVPTTSNLTKSLLMGPSARRQFEGKEGSRANRENHHPRAKFSIGGGSGAGDGERGRAMGRKSVGGLSSRSSNVYPPPSASISTSSSYREDILGEDESFVGAGGFGGGITPRYAGHGAMSFGREEERGNREQRGRSRGVRRGFTMDPSTHHDEDAWLMVDDDAAAADERLRRGRNEAVKILS